tara:strand:- start:2658 stop:5618 length:2961 start_codon:yes stop_codon:yes gene_type:complete
MAETQTITLADIRANPALNKANLKPGDTYTMREDGSFNVKRVFSEDGVVELGIVITEEMLKNQPELAEMGVEAGDRYLEDQHKIIKTGSGSAWEQYWHAFKETPGMTRNAADILESWLPIGTFDLFTNDSVFGYKSPEESYGEGFGEADNKTQRQMIRRARERETLKDTRLFTPDPNSMARMAGQFTAAIADPTSFIPFIGPAAKAATLGAKALRFGANVGIGGGLGAGYSVTDDLAAGEDVDVMKALQTGALAAGGTGALLGLGKGVSRIRDNAANKQIDAANRIMARKKAAGLSIKDTMDEAQQEILAMRGMPIQKAMERTGRKLKIPGTVSEADEILKNALADETVSRFYNKGLDNFLGSISTRIGKISEPILMRMRLFEFNLKKNTQSYLNEAAPFIRSLSNMKGPVKDSLARHLSNQNFSAAERLMAKHGSSTMVDEFKPVVSRLRQLHDELEVATGGEVGYVQNFFPRVLTRDGYKQLQKLWDRQPENLLTKRLKEEVSKRRYASIDDIPEHRKYEIANQLAAGFTKTGKSMANKNRKVDVVTEDMLPSYESPEKALQLYLRNAVNTIERGKFFGKHQKGKGYKGLNLKTTVKDVETGVVREMDIDESIGELINTHASGTSGESQGELLSLIQSRFKGGEKTTGYAIGALRDLGYMGTIANPISAITQLGDMGVSAALHGFKNTIGAMLGTKNVRMLDIGLDDAAQEFADITKTSNFLRGLFKYSGFRAVDRLGKETSINAALKKNFNLVKTVKGEAAFIKKWGKFYGDDIKKLVDDLKANKVTESVKFHSFNELSDMQPISMLEMPQKYVDHPDGRILYALKTFTLKQYDVVRRNIVQEYAAGNKAKAVKQAAYLAGYLSAANVGTQTIKDIMLGRDPELDNIPDKSLWALLGVYGFNKYGADKYLKDGKLTDWAINTIAPAAPIVDAITGLAAESVKEDPNANRYLRAMPLIGPMLYNWFGGGAELYNERVEKARDKR